MKLENWGNWSDWELLMKADLALIPNQPGAYMIAAKHSIHRAFGEDPEGILDVGESKNLRDRIRAFIGCANGNRSSGHMAGWRFYEFDFNLRFPVDSLYLSWHKADSKAEAYALEESILKEYLAQHSELPPLNYKYNWGYGNDE